MTDREIFERVRAHLLAQTDRAVTDDGECRYRSGDLKCAVGCLIPDSVYSVAIEDRAVRHLITPRGSWESSNSFDAPLARALNDSGVPGLDSTRILLVHLQQVHDGEGPGQWPASLGRIATMFDDNGVYRVNP